MILIALDTQIHIYSVDTGAFYTDEENNHIKAQNTMLRLKTQLKAEKDTIERELKGVITSKTADREIRRIYRLEPEAELPERSMSRIDDIKTELKTLNKQINASKNDFLVMLRSQQTKTRQLRPEHLKETNVISLFESQLTRTLRMQPEKLYTSLIVVRTYYYEILKDLVLSGFELNGERYVLLTASAGQIRTKKTVFIRESLLEQYRLTLMCGLTLEHINKKGGINVNKYLAYMALNNSATDLFPRFDITKSIVVDDMETVVTGVVDFIDHKTYEITRKEMGIPITHTDGCGMMLPCVSRKNLQLRMPWVKGLLAVFPFDMFIREADEREPDVNHGVVTDIYGQEHDVIAEGIEVIFTKSQFKMWKYYDNWQQYIDYFKRYGCQAGMCNVERDFITNSKLSYQMLQTLTDLTPDELKQLSYKSNDRITKIASDKAVQLSVLGADEYNDQKNDFQECLQLYPELLSDPYTKNLLKQIKAKMVKEARSGKLSINGKYLFIIPDLYAFCQYLFEGNKNPEGLLQDGEVSCRIYKRYDKLDCLRSPHLYREHGVRQNIYNADTKKWFSERGLYTSCHDLISKLLMFDCDGDTALVCAEPVLVQAAERNMQGVVPLYYEMGKAAAAPVDNEALYNGMIAAYSGGNIGMISNDISKIWNSSDPDIEIIKFLVMEDNFTVDYAKTLFKPTRPDDINARVNALTGQKVPYFFCYAKDKESKQIEPKNNSVVNQLEDLITNKRMNFKNMGSFDYRMLMACPKAHTDKLSNTIKSRFDELSKKYRYAYVLSDEETPNHYIKQQLLFEMFDGESDTPSTVCDSLIYYLFVEKDTRSKTLFWMCFGDIVLDNIEYNLSCRSAICSVCGRRYFVNEKDLVEPYYCLKCRNPKHPKEKQNKPKKPMSKPSKQKKKI